MHVYVHIRNFYVHAYIGDFCLIQQASIPTTKDFSPSSSSKGVIQRMCSADEGTFFILSIQKRDTRADLLKSGAKEIQIFYLSASY